MVERELEDPITREVAAGRLTRDEITRAEQDID